MSAPVKRKVVRLANILSCALMIWTAVLALSWMRAGATAQSARDVRDALRIHEMQSGADVASLKDRVSMLEKQVDRAADRIEALQAKANYYGGGIAMLLGGIAVLQTLGLIAARKS